MVEPGNFDSSMFNSTILGVPPLFACLPPIPPHVFCFSSTHFLSSSLRSAPQVFQTVFYLSHTNNKWQSTLKRTKSIGSPVWVHLLTCPSQLQTGKGLRADHLCNPNFTCCLSPPAHLTNVLPLKSTFLTLWICNWISAGKIFFKALEVC